MKFFDTLFGTNKAPERGSDAYVKQQDIATQADTKTRLKLAKSSSTNREILYYLAKEDPDAAVRLAVADNTALPVQASAILAKDDNIDVRMALAARLVSLLPDLSQDKHSKLYAFAVQALSTLALDEVLKIRKALSSALKDHAYTPPKVAGQLARDLERDVSEPILRYCAALSDEDLLDILKDHPDSWIVQAIAARDTVSLNVSGAVINTRDAPGGRTLLDNEGAQIDAPLLQEIIAQAKTMPEWHAPIALRTSLPPEIAMELASFTDERVKDLLLAREDFDAPLLEEISETFRRRVDFASEAAHNDTLKIEQRIAKAVQDNKLNEDTISDAMGMRDHDFVIGALAHLCDTPFAQISHNISVATPRSIVALCWRAGLSMRFALRAQQEIAQILPKDLLYPKDGQDYPLSKDDMIFQLDLIGIKVD